MQILPVKGFTNFSFSRLKRNHGLWLMTCGYWLVTNSVDNIALSQNLTSSPLPSERGVKVICAEQSLEVLTTQLLRDLPSYTNRTTQRARRLNRSYEVYSYVLVAGRPEFTPLALNPKGSTLDGEKTSAAGVEQVFFTTLERQYIGKKAVELQQFHRLLLTKTKNGWRLVMMFTRTDAYRVGKLPSPPRDSSKSAIAQAINDWLRDCQAGSVR